MKTHELTLCQIGNSRGLRLPARVLRRYGFAKKVLMEEKADELVIKPVREKKLSWADTFKEMAAAKESWKEWDATAGDGLNDL